MKKIITLSFLCGLLNMAFGQEHIKTTFSEETDTLVKQRFIDRYENIFMTKVPTRHMVKMDIVMNTGLSSDLKLSDISNLNYQMGYEFKVSPEFSLGVNALLKNYYTTNGGNGRIISAGLLGRWYFDMKRRIREGKSANNFSGNYLSAVHERQWELSAKLAPSSKSGVEFGMQRRFLNYGRIDFAIGIFYQHYSDSTNRSNMFFQENRSDFAIITRTNLGLAFGDWKRTNNLPVCEMLRCDEFLGSQWKVLWPVLNLGPRTQRATVGLAYERKIGKTPLSLNAQIFADYYHHFNGYIINFRNTSDVAYQIQPSLQMRYYFLQKRKIKRGTGGNNLSGLYLGPYSDYVKISERLNQEANKREHLGAGFIVGYQKTLLRNGYIDIYSEESWNLLRRVPGTKSHIGSFRVGFGVAF